MRREPGVLSHWLATRVTGTLARSAARNRMSLIGPGQASASTQIRGVGVVVAVMRWRLAGVRQPSPRWAGQRTFEHTDGMTIGADAQGLVGDPEAMGLLPESVRRQMAASGPSPFEGLS